MRDLYPQEKSIHLQAACLGRSNVSRARRPNRVGEDDARRAMTI